jgi:hypothetical protein
MKSAETDGWAAVRLAVLGRDRGCVAVQRELVGDLADGKLCRDDFGAVHGWDAIFKLQLDHVKEQPRMGLKAPDDEAHLQAICAQHHRTWATRSEVRAWARERLARLYPEAWNATA